MSATEIFINGLQEATSKDPFSKKFWGNYPEKANHTFEDALNKYAEYYQTLNSSQQQEISTLFWNQIKTLGTPIIENQLGSDHECNVYFLMPKDKISGSTETSGSKISYDLALMSNNKLERNNIFEFKWEKEGFRYRVTGLDNKEKSDLIPWSKLPDDFPKDDETILAKEKKLLPAILKITSEAGHTPKKDLYLQGDFHGYGSTENKQRLLELSDTGIMWHKDSMPKDALVAYSYIEVEPSHRGIKPEPERSFFKDGEGFTFHSTKTNFPEIPSDVCWDEYSTHLSSYPGFPFPERIFRVSADLTHAHIPGKRVDWPSLLSTETANNTKHFVYHTTLYSDKDGDLHRSEAPVTDQYHDDLYYSDQADSPYAGFTRNIQVFKPASGKVDDVIVINDGILYLIAGMMDHFEKMVDEKKLSPNMALVFVGPMPGIKATLSAENKSDFEQDPSVDLPGMGVRLVDYKHEIDQYIDFIANKLFTKLDKEIGLPKDPNHRVMIGSSMSGTASIYIGLKSPGLFGAVIAQSPSPDNRVKLSEIPKEMLKKSNIFIHVSCGQFEHPDYAAANDNIGYATDLSRKLGVPLYIGAYGHLCVPWAIGLEQSLPATLEASHALSVRNHKKLSKSPSTSSKSIFSHPENKASTMKPDKQDEKIQVLRKKGG